ncbi:SlyX family protein [Kordiimonas sp. SCSIO 12603]|uniref:SlyX family protein n=1 Tax=Kordiimonas sp. SCSIO 12603 TaxID=2829596 RepID=UPI0021051058|nr:SlyX family protein [Kordiimonas sp. SCSIO 12603]UTW59330.1 SlyX family protein [Kordiimonas sp. SCSIO 12603]
MADLEEKLTDLECKFAFQQETIDTLNTELTKQWKEIDSLKNAIHRLHEQLLDLESSSGKPEIEPPPPHY